MTGEESRRLVVGAKVWWNADKNDTGMIMEKDWAGVVVKWDSRQKQAILHNDMAAVSNR